MQQRKHQIDYPLLFIVIGLMIISLIAVYSGSGQYTQDSTFYFVQRQFIWYIIGFAIMFSIAFFDYELLERMAIYLYGIGLGLLLAVHFMGTTKNGSQRWIDLGFMDLQPSEFMKIFLILHVSVLLKRIGEERISFARSIPFITKVIIYSSIPFALILVQPDLGSALIIAFIVITMIFISSISIKMISLLGASFVGLFFLVRFLFQHYFDAMGNILQPHQMGRIYGWLRPDEFASGYGYQLKQAILGIGAGQLTGHGFNQGIQVQNGKIPEAHTDFIFAVIGEEFGFIGASLLIILYFLLIYRIITIGLSSTNLFGTYICVGVTGLLAFQVFQNIAMTIGLMPITGVTMPFISYGGSALLANMMALGLVLSVRMHSKEFMFSNE